MHFKSVVIYHADEATKTAWTYIWGRLAYGFKLWDCTANCALKNIIHSDLIPKLL